MSTYYAYRDVKVMIAHKLMQMDGWKVYGYEADNSDAMTDYYDPASWSGVAEKNGYILCIDVCDAAEPYEVKRYNNINTIDRSTMEKIEKLEKMTVERGASEQEEETAKKAIKTLRGKAEGNEEKYTVKEIIPGHMANPPRMNWHIEKDGVYIAKGNGILKFAHVDSYYRYLHYEESMKKYKEDPEAWKIAERDSEMNRWNESLERATEIAENRAKEMEEDLELINKFEAFITKLDTTCGGMIGEGEQVIYEKKIVTEYKKENKAIKTESGSIKDGQCFIVNVSFNYGHNKGYVYRIHATEYDGKTIYHAYKLNGKLTKECHGMASSGNYWYLTDNFTRWFENGSLSWCEIQEVKTPYEVEKVVKKVLKADKKPESTTATADTVADGNYHYTVTEDTDTRDNSKIWLVKVDEKLEREEYKRMASYMKSLGGYYSRFKHSFLFREDPTGLLNGNVIEATQTATEQQEQTETEETPIKSIEWIVTEDTHTKTGKQIFVVKPKEELSKEDFGKTRQKLATMQGFYSSFVHGFIFKYDPTEQLQGAV